ncbi:hypothetical protein EDD18DRAFT_1138617 [Armillaria luteobubalina]|uniref:Uncharacterized protein n=1 Tax=Armillaria luteobubalina TaxID=153913 RepID=A0AA39V1M9_9AGAR|nr:hypothetical protein EDD18DRAFT_1138617 [Armillaria luteobubalina]
MDDTYLDNPILYQLSQPVPRPLPSAETLSRIQSLKERHTQLCAVEGIVKPWSEMNSRLQTWVSPFSNSVVSPDDGCYIAVNEAIVKLGSKLPTEYLPEWPVHRERCSGGLGSSNTLLFENFMSGIISIERKLQRDKEYVLESIRRLGGSL